MIDVKAARVHELSAGETAWPTIALCLGALALQIGSAVYLPLIPAILIGAACAYAQFTVAHDASHMSISKKAWVNLFWGYIATGVLFGPFEAFKRNHLHHHAHTNDPAEDPDFWVNGKNFLHTFWRCATLFWRHYFCYFAQLKRRDAVFVRTLLVVAAIAGLMTAFPGPLFWHWFLPSQIAGAALAFTFDYWPHRPHTGRGRLKDTASIDVRFFDPFFLNQNIHLLHHLFPTIPWYRYRPAWAAILPGVRSEGGLVWDLKTALRML